MGNRFCVILSQGNNTLAITSRPRGKVYQLRQGQLFIGDGTPYKAYNQGEESWHIIGHIDNLPLLNYLLFNYYPSNADFISEEIISLAVKRHGMSIIELLRGNFCIIQEDPEGNLTLVTEDEEQSASAGAVKHQDDYATGCGTGCNQAAYTASPCALRDRGGNAPRRDAVAACRSPAGDYDSQCPISISRWRDNHLQFIRSFRAPLDSAAACPGREINSDGPPDVTHYIF